MREFERFLAGVRPQIDDALERLLPAATERPERLHRAIRYSIFAGGKRVRPALTVLGGEILGAGRESLLAPAAAMEMIHTFSLVHDDLPALDDDDLRRGRATVHREFDEATAVLVGDSLLNLGLQTLATEPPEAPSEVRRLAVELVARAVGTAGMIGGQMDDLEAEREWPEDPKRALEAIHDRKTGALLTASLELGGIHAGAEPETLEIYRQLGRRIGLMFQIGDDILDVESSAAVLGKAVGKDAAASKLTYPGLHGVARSKELLARVGDESLEMAARLPGGGRTLPSFIDYLSTRDH